MKFLAQFSLLTDELSIRAVIAYKHRLSSTNVTAYKRQDFLAQLSLHTYTDFLAQLSLHTNTDFLTQLSLHTNTQNHMQMSHTRRDEGGVGEMPEEKRSSWGWGLIVVALGQPIHIFLYLSVSDSFSPLSFPVIVWSSGFCLVKYGNNLDHPFSKDLTYFPQLPQEIHGLFIWSFPEDTLHIYPGHVFAIFSFLFVQKTHKKRTKRSTEVDIRIIVSNNSMND